MIDNLLYGTEIYFQLARFVLILLIGVTTTRALIMPLIVKILSRRGTSVKAKHSIENITALLGIFITLIIALQAASFGNLLTILGTLAAAATVAIGFGMRDQVSSIVAGVFIHMDNPFVKGDYIRTGDTEGVIKNISLRTTTLNGENNAKQIVPNNILTTTVVKNYTKGSKTKVSIESKVDTSKAEKHAKILLKSIEEDEKALENPKPEIKYKSLTEGKTDLEATFWIKNAEEVKKTRSQILENYQGKANKKGLFEKESKDKN